MFIRNWAAEGLIQLTLICLLSDGSRGGVVEVRDFKKKAKEGER